MNTTKWSYPTSPKYEELLSKEYYLESCVMRGPRKPIRCLNGTSKFIAQNLTQYSCFQIDILGLIVACISHDLDHRGTNNSFQHKMNNPLAKLYSTSTLERHHLNQCLLILTLKGNQILDNLTKVKIFLIFPPNFYPSQSPASKFLLALIKSWRKNRREIEWIGLFG